MILDRWITLRNRRGETATSTTDRTSSTTSKNDVSKRKKRKFFGLWKKCFASNENQCSYKDYESEYENSYNYNQYQNMMISDESFGYILYKGDLKQLLFSEQEMLELKKELQSFFSTSST